MADAVVVKRETKEDAQFAFRWKLGMVAMDSATRLELTDAADAYALAVHVEACGKRTPVTDADGMRGLRDCGDGWYCDKAPVQGA